jgi:hypothetical protein
VWLRLLRKPQGRILLSRRGSLGPLGDRRAFSSYAEDEKSAGLRSRVRLLVQDGQVLDDNECAEPNESRQADREQNPDKFRLLGVEVRHAHRSSTRQLRLRPVIQRDICDGEKAAWRRMVGGPRSYLSF